MSLLSASWLLTTASLRNRVRRFTRRLQQPRYLLATIAAATYFYLLVFRRLGGVPRPGFSTGGLGGVELVLIAIVTASLAMTWLLGRDDAVLTFTEAEIQLLFPAPVSRRSLVLFKLNRNLLRALFSAILSTLFFGRGFTGHPVLFTLGFWLGISTLMLHGTAASFARQSLAEHGFSGLRRRALTVVVFAAVAGALGVWATSALPPPPEVDPDALLAYGHALVEAAPLRYVLWPVRALTGLVVAPETVTFLARLPAALAVFGAHYAWVVLGHGAFEEASVEAAESRAKDRERRRSPLRGLSFGKVKSARLNPRGRPELGLAWKNVLGLRRSLGLRLLPVLLTFGLMAFLLAKLAAGPANSGMRQLVGGGALFFAALTTVMGPLWARFDFRTDVKNMEALRALPLSGRQVSAGQLAGPALVLAFVEWTLLAVGLALGGGALAPVLSFGRLVGAALALAAVAPLISAAGLVLHNGVALLYPDWVAAPPAASRGVEMLGQRLITVFGTLALLSVALLPAAVVAALATWLAWPLGAVAPLLGGVLACAAIGVELWLGVMLLGRLYDRYDVSAT